jgi:hypothetical protein
MKGAKLLSKKFQPSLTEWFKAAGDLEKSEQFCLEDSGKNNRLSILKSEIKLPIEKTFKFSAQDLYNKTPEVKNVLNKHGNDLCAFRLVPRNSHLPVMRNRGRTIRKCYENWFVKLQIDFAEYDVFICKHQEEAGWSPVFVINDKGILEKL